MNIKQAPTVVLLSALCGAASAQTVANASFDAPDGGWITENDAQMAFPGGNAGWTWNTTLVGLPVISDETVFPTDGFGFGITYAGADSYTQVVNFPSAGTYTLMVDVNGVRGTVDGFNMVDGQFRLFAGGNNSPTQTAIRDAEWTTYSWDVTLPAGPSTIGIENTLAARYVIAYDNFRIVPTPASAALLGAAGLFASRRRRA